MKILKFLFVLCMFAVVSPAVAQQAVTGHILDAETGAPVVGRSEEHTSELQSQR